VIDPDAVGRIVGPIQESWDIRDCLLYALGVGAGADDPAAELDLTTEVAGGRPMQVLPTYAVVVAARLRQIYRELGEVDWTKVVHGRQRVELFRALRTEGQVDLHTQITGIYDKRSAAVVELTTTADDARTGVRVFRTRSTLFIRGAGGWGGDRGPSGGTTAQDRAPDVTSVMRTRPDQALLYRLTGDLNPMHCDPEFARRAGFSRPILHGLCTYGFTGRALLHELCDSEAARFRGMDARFSRPVLPGSELRVELWRTGEGRAAFRTLDGDGHVVLDGGECWYEPSDRDAGELRRERISYYHC
jgi:acyl dehydratase